MSDFPYSAHPELRGLDHSEAWCFVDYANLLRSRYGRGRTPVTTGTAGFLKPPAPRGPRRDHAHLVAGEVLLPQWSSICDTCVEHDPRLREDARKRDVLIARLPPLPRHCSSTDLLDTLAKEPAPLLIIIAPFTSRFEIPGVPPRALARATDFVAVICWSLYKRMYRGITLYRTASVGLGAEIAHFERGAVPKQAGS